MEGIHQLAFPQELTVANNILIGSVCSEISTQAMEYHIRRVKEVLAGRRKASQVETTGKLGPRPANFWMDKEDRNDN